MMKSTQSLCRLVAVAATAIITDTFCFAQEGRPAPLVRAGIVEVVQNNVNRRYAGQVTSPSHVALVARVSGELLQVGFKEGDVVTKGQLLYRLDDVRYSASVASAQANIERCEASLKYTTSNLARVEALYKKNVTTKDAYEQAAMAMGTDKANLHLAKANLITAQDDLKNTKILAPISGKISLTNYTVGNYLTPASGTLATLVQLDPLRVGFSIASRDYLTLFKNEADFRDNAQIRIKLANGVIYDQNAVFEFRNNEANRSTDTIQIYARIANPDLVLVPGSSVTVLLTRKSAERRAAILPSAIMSDQNSTYVYVIDANNVANRCNVKLGAASGKLQMIDDGLTGGEKIVIDGVHKVIPGQKVQIAAENAK